MGGSTHNFLFTNCQRAVRFLRRQNACSVNINKNMSIQYKYTSSEIRSYISFFLTDKVEKMYGEKYIPGNSNVIPFVY